MNQIYTVKEASRILGFSTNTVYKYLNEGRLKAARGDIEQGRFRIPHQAIEEFLGTEIPQDIISHLRAEEPPAPRETQNAIVTVQVSPPTLPLAIARVLIVFSLLSIILDIIVSPTVSLFGQISRIIAIGIFILLSYQHLSTKPISYGKPVEPNQTNQ